MIKKMSMLLATTLMLSSCINSEEIEDIFGKIDDLKPGVEQIKINNSSRNLPWTVDYSRALDDIYEHAELDKLFDTVINQNDLSLVKCKNFPLLTRDQKKVFYTVYLAAIAESESDFRTNLKTVNPGDNTVNVGLLQIDEAAGRNHTKGALGNMSEDSLTDARLNLQVGAFVLKNQLRASVSYGRLFPDKSYYWSVLTTKSRVLANIEKNRNNIKFCR